MTATNDHRLINQFRAVAFFDGGIKCIAIKVTDKKVRQFSVRNGAFGTAG